jgi:DNA-binding beta-propeller fold protein YncE
MAETFAQPQPQGQVQLTPYARIQNLRSNTGNANDIYDRQVYSPKSALFSADGRKLYINSLEGGQTLVYSWPDLKKMKTINHTFNAKNDFLFQGESTAFGLPFFTSSADGNPNHFMGKPVEMALSHQGRYLWITYYRRSYDSSAQSPSAVAVVDTETDQIVRVIPTGPIPKFIAISPDNKTAAIIHWGNNTVGLMDISSRDPKDFSYKGLVTIEHSLDQSDLANTDRDRTCGFCLRGAVFDQSSHYLFVARMGGGGVAGIDVTTNEYLGTTSNFPPTPRHLALTSDQQNLIVSSNVGGYLSKVSVKSMIAALTEAHGRRVKGPTVQSVFVGVGARTVEVQQNGPLALVAVNNDVQLVAVDLQQMKVVARQSIDPFPVGLAISRDDQFAVVTSQGRGGHGGNAVNILRIELQAPLRLSLH